MPRPIAVTFDYRCPFASNGNAAAVAALRAGADLDVRFLPFSLDQAHIGEGEPDVWDREPDKMGSGALSLQWGLAVRDSFPEHFLDAHLALFAARHDQGLRLELEETVRDVVASVGLDVDAVAAEVATGRPLKTLATEHAEAVERWGVWGVPTFIEGNDAAFVRFMERGRVEDLERMLELLSWTSLNEFKRPAVER